MVINYLEVEVRFARQKKIKQSMKLSEWARVEFETKRGLRHETNGVR